MDRYSGVFVKDNKKETANKRKVRNVKNNVKKCQRA